MITEAHRLMGGIHSAVEGQDKGMQPELFRFFDRLALAVMDCRSKSFEFVYNIPTKLFPIMMKSLSGALTQAGINYTMNRTGLSMVFTVPSGSKIDVTVSFDLR